MLHMERSQVVKEVTDLMVYFTELSSQATATIAERDRVRQHLAVRVSRETQSRQMLAGRSNDGSSGGSGDSAAS